MPVNNKHTTLSPRKSFGLHQSVRPLRGTGRSWPRRWIDRLSQSVRTCLLADLVSRGVGRWTWPRAPAGALCLCSTHASAVPTVASAVWVSSSQRPTRNADRLTEGRDSPASPHRPGMLSLDERTKGVRCTGFGSDVQGEALTHEAQLQSRALIRWLVGWLVGRPPTDGHIRAMCGSDSGSSQRPPTHEHA